jgi:SAM-dependent methyltransferase
MSVQLDEYDEYKARQRDLWSAGDYALLSERIADVGELTAMRAELEPGLEVLDVACGAGNASLPAARIGARVTGVDLAPALLERGRTKAEREGVEITWVEGDAEELPFPDDSFDRVLSTFGHMFAPRHRRAADEMLRVCRPGGMIVTATWTADGTVGKMFAAGAPFLPPPPEYASPPVLWGREEYIHEMFGDAARSIEVDRHVNWIVDDSVESFADFFLSTFPPLVTAQAMLGERFGELREAIVAVWRDANVAQDGAFRLPQEYLLSVVRV